MVWAGSCSSFGALGDQATSEHEPTTASSSDSGYGHATPQAVNPATFARHADRVRRASAMASGSRPSTTGSDRVEAIEPMRGLEDPTSRVPRKPPWSDQNTRQGGAGNPSSGALAGPYGR